MAFCGPECRRFRDVGHWRREKKFQQRAAPRLFEDREQTTGVGL